MKYSPAILMMVWSFGLTWWIQTTRTPPLAMQPTKTHHPSNIRHPLKSCPQQALPPNPHPYNWSCAGTATAKGQARTMLAWSANALSTPIAGEKLMSAAGGSAPGTNWHPPPPWKLLRLMLGSSRLASQCSLPKN